MPCVNRAPPPGAPTHGCQTQCADCAALCAAHPALQRYLYQMLHGISHCHCHRYQHGARSMLLWRLGLAAAAA